MKSILKTSKSLFKIGRDESATNLQASSPYVGWTRGTFVYNEKSASLSLSIDKKSELMGGAHELEFVKGQTVTHTATWKEEVTEVVVLVVGRWGTESNEGEGSSLLLLVSLPAHWQFQGWATYPVSLPAWVWQFHGHPAISSHLEFGIQFKLS